MSITGMMKVLYQNKLLTEAFTLTASTNNAAGVNLYDLDRDTKWRSSGSNDTVTETITAVFTYSQTIDRILLLGMNFKEFTIKYWNGSSYVNFSNVIEAYGVSAGSAISSTTNTSTSKYYEVTPVSTLRVQISILKTITAGQEKEMMELYIGDEIGTFLEDVFSSPSKFEATYSDTNSTYLTKSNGGTIKYERSDKYNAKVKLSELWETNDQGIVNTMYDEGQFAIYPCGGIPYTQYGMRAQDLYHVIIRGNLELAFAVGRDSALGLNYQFELLEQ